MFFINGVLLLGVSLVVFIRCWKIEELNNAELFAFVVFMIGVVGAIEIVYGIFPLLIDMAGKIR